MGMSAFADELHAVKMDRTQASAKAKMPERKIPVTVDVHTASTLWTSAVSIRQIELAVKAQHFAARSCPVYACVRIIKAFQPGGDA
jgi:hypothetical protein